MDPITIDQAIRIVPNGLDSAVTVIWIIKAIAFIAGTLCSLKSSELLSNDEYLKATRAITGTFICFAAPELAKLFNLS